MKLRFDSLYFYLLLIPLVASCSREPKNGSSETTNIDLAKKTIEEILKADDIRSSADFDYGNKIETSKYFDSTLVRLFKEEVDCKTRTKEICNLDGNPIYNAQDFTQNEIPVQIENESVSPNMVFNVKIENGGEQNLKYILAKENGKWRIQDIKYPEGKSLKELLSNRTYWH